MQKPHKINENCHKFGLIFGKKLAHFWKEIGSFLEGNWLDFWKEIGSFLEGNWLIFGK